MKTKKTNRIGFIFCLPFLVAGILFAQNSGYILQIGHMSPVNKILFSHDQSLFFSRAQSSNEVFSWEVLSGRKTGVYWEKGEDRLGDFTVDTSRREIYLLYGSGKMVIWNYVNGNRVGEVKVPQGKYIQLLLKNNKFYFIGSDGMLCKMDRISNETVFTQLVQDKATINKVTQITEECTAGKIGILYECLGKFSKKTGQKYIRCGVLTDDQCFNNKTFSDPNPPSYFKSIGYSFLDTFYNENSYRYEKCYRTSSGEIRHKQIRFFAPFQIGTSAIHSSKFDISGTYSGKVIITDKNGNHPVVFKLEKSGGLNALMNSAVTCLSITRNEKILAAGTGSGNIFLIDLEKMQLLETPKIIRKTFNGLKYSEFGNVLFITTKQNDLLAFNYRTGAVLRIDMGEVISKNLRGINFERVEGDSLLVLKGQVGSEKVVQVSWNIVRNKLEMSEVYFGDVAKVVKYFSKRDPLRDSAVAIKISRTEGINFKITRNDSLIKTIKTSHSGEITAVCYNKAYGYISTASLDGTIRHWNPQTGEEIFSSVILSPSLFIHFLPGHTYYGTKRIFEWINFIENGKVIPEEKVRDKYNRPDLVIQAIPQHTRELAEAIEWVYSKRPKGLLTATAGHIVFAAEKQRIAGNEMFINVHAVSEENSMAKIHILVNGVDESIFTQAGKEVSQTISIELDNGANTVEMYAEDAVGNYSGKMVFEENFHGKKKPDLYLFCVGLSSYRDSSKNLQYSSKDASEIFTLFDKSKLYNKVHKKLMLNRDATVLLADSLKNFLKQAGRTDQVVVFYAGHGILDSKLNYFLSTYETDFLFPEKNSVMFDEVEKILSESACRKKLFLIDACHSGDIEKESMKRDTSRTFVMEEQLVFRSSSNMKLSQNELSLMLSKELFASGSNFTGTSIIGASAGSQFALESHKWNNGAFTYAILKGIKKWEADLNEDGEISIAELQYYVNKVVPALTDGKQVPTTRTENLVNNFRIR